MPDYAKSLALARRLIQGAGRSVTFLQLDSSTPDPAKPWEATDAPRETPAASVAASAVFVPAASASSLGITTERAEFVKDSEQVALVEVPEAFSGNLRNYHELLDGDVRWRVKVVEELKPGGTALLYFVGVAR